MASTPNLSNPNYSFDKTKQFTQVVFQQGKPILDVDLNEMSAALQAQATSALIEKMGYGPSQVDYKEWAMTSVSSQSPESNRNIYNFAMTLGRLDTYKGIVDLHEVRDSAYDSRVIFDYGLIEDNAATLNDDRAYANYILKGSVTGDQSTTLNIKDEHKDFDHARTGHRLASYTYRETLSPAYATVEAITDPTTTRTPKPCIVQIQESACRLRFLTGGNAGEEREIQSAGNGYVIVSNAFTNTPAEGDEYIILPPNSLSEYKGLYDSASSQLSSQSFGLAKLPKLVSYVQVFEEDISSEEDADIKSSIFGQETTHRTQLRWCIRVAKLTVSIEGDTSNAVPVTDLGLEHIFTFMKNNLYVEHQALVDATDATASVDEGLLQTQYWRESDGATLLETQILKQESPYLELGLTPAHFFSAQEVSLDRIYWSFLKGFFLKSNTSVSGIAKCDFVILNQFYSESKSNVDPANETLSQYFYPGAKTDTTATPIEHAFLSVGNSYQRVNGDTAANSGSFKAPPRVFQTQADLSTDNMQSRTLFGLKGGILYGSNAPLVFKSTSSHLSFVDQMLLGMSGLGSSQGETSEGYRIPSAIDYTLANTTTSLSQSGTGVGAIKMLSPISAATISTGQTGSFVTGSSSYLLRDKGNRSTHTVNAADSDLGWSLYKQEGSSLVDSDNYSDFSIRGWEEGMAQAVAFQQGINFRKLAIKTTAHKSMDLFTISQMPVQANNALATSVIQKAPSTAFQIPYQQVSDKNGNAFLDSYSGAVNNESQSTSVTAYSSFPADDSDFNAVPLLQQYQRTGTGVTSFINSDTNSRDLSVYYGPWNRFNTATLKNLNAVGQPFESGVGFLDNADTPIFSTDLWDNRCTAMRLRYHVGDFYPGDNDSRGVPRNLLVDSMNLFMKVEPLSLAHWMTMPKHQHSILENSLSFAEGIEALLKVSHGLGDTQKLINSLGQPLVQANSPILDEIPLYDNKSVGDVDPINLPFEHHKHPFVHWYHPNMHKIQGPHPDGTNDVYTNSSNVDYTVTLYPKWGRRSLVIPALVPSKFNSADRKLIDGTDEYSVPYTEVTDTSVSPNVTTSFPNILGSDSDTSDGYTVDVSSTTDAVVINNSTLPYPFHATQNNAIGTTDYTTDNNQVLTFRNNQITFPAVGSYNYEVAPGPVFLPASRVYAQQDGSNTEAQVGFNPLMTHNFTTAYWNDVDPDEAYFPYDEVGSHYAVEAGGYTELDPTLRHSFDVWSVPVLRAAISTHTVAGVVELVRTSFQTGLSDTTLNSDYDFTMPTNVFNNFSSGDVTSNQTPSMGPDLSADTLFVGDLGTALGGFSNRSGFISPLNFGVPMRVTHGLMPNGVEDTSADVRDSFDLFIQNTQGGLSPLIRKSFEAINSMGLQQKLMWNCSFRVLHSRIGGQGTTVSTAPKSLTEVFLAHNRVDGNMTKTTFPAPSDSQKKPYIHLLSMHPNAHDDLPNKDKMSHLYPMISDSTGGPHEATLTNNEYDYTDNQVKTASMGDTYAADPFDTMINDAVFGNDNPLRERDLLEKNSGIEIDLLSELNTIHDNISSYGLDTVATVNTVNLKLQDTMPTANELTLPGDHELVFVLYTGHYGAKMYDTNDEVNVSYIPPVAGCHLTATLEINRPSERSDSSATTNIHYGKTMNSNSDPIITYAIPSTK